MTAWAIRSGPDQPGPRAEHHDLVAEQFDARRGRGAGAEQLAVAADPLVRDGIAIEFAQRDRDAERGSRARQAHDFSVSAVATDAPRRRASAIALAGQQRALDLDEVDGGRPP